MSLFLLPLVLVFSAVGSMSKDRRWATITAAVIGVIAVVGAVAIIYDYGMEQYMPVTSEVISGAVTGAVFVALWGGAMFALGTLFAKSKLAASLSLVGCFLAFPITWLIASFMISQDINCANVYECPSW